MREYEQKVASIHAWVIATKAENDELRKEVKRITGEHTHLQESVIKPLENVLVPVGLYSHQSYAACVTAMRDALAEVTRERDQLRDSLRQLQADAFMSGVAGNHLACAIPYAVEWEKFTRDQAHDYFVSRNRNQVAYEVWTAWRILMDCSQRQRGEAAYGDVLARLNEWESDTALSAQPEPKPEGRR